MAARRGSTLRPVGEAKPETDRLRIAAGTRYLGCAVVDARPNPASPASRTDGADHKSAERRLGRCCLHAGKAADVQALAAILEKAADGARQEVRFTEVAAEPALVFPIARHETRLEPSAFSFAEERGSARGHAFDRPWIGPAFFDVDTWVHGQFGFVSVANCTRSRSQPVSQRPGNIRCGR